MRENLGKSASSLRWCVVAALMILLGPFARGADSPQPVLDAGYPGGNIRLEKVEADTWFLKPDLRDIQSGKRWFYWSFRVRGAAGRTLHFRFTGDNPLGVRGPAVSQDGGLTWKWMGAAAVRKVTNQEAWEFDFSFAKDEEVRFCYTIPYLQNDLDQFLARCRSKPSALVAGELCRSRHGRRVEFLRLGDLSGAPNYRVLLTARHHACESIASYELEGIMESVLAETPEGRLWRKEIEVMVVPFMDKDGVEEGDQGKLRAPHDHNRDYAGSSIYPEVAALRERVPAWGQGKPLFALDLHCPGVRETKLYFVGGADQVMWSKVMEFSRLLETSQQGPIRYHLKDNMPFGQGWNVAATFAEGKGFGAWAQELPNVSFASSFEFPYAEADHVEVTVESARRFGRDLAHAMVLFLTKPAK